MDAPHVVVVEEVVDSLLFESDLMGNLIRRYSSINNDHGEDHGPVMFRDKIIDNLDDTVKMDLTPDDEPKTPEDDDQDMRNETTTEEQNIGLDAASDVFTALVDQPNGDLMIARRIEFSDTATLELRSNLPEIAQNEDAESKTDEDYDEFDPMDYLYFKSGPTEKSNDVLMAEEELHEASVNFDLDLLPTTESEAADQDVLYECTTEDNTTFGTANACENQINDNESDQEMRLDLSSDHQETVQDNSQTSDFGSTGCKNDDECNSNHGIVCVKTSDYNDESDQEVKLNLSSDEQDVRDNGQSEEMIEPVTTSDKLEDDMTPPTSPKLNQDNTVTKHGDPVNISQLDDDTCQQDEATKKEPSRSRKKLQVTPIKGKVYNTRRRKMRKIKVSPNLGSEISSTSSSSDEENSSWSAGTTSIDSSDETDCSSDSFSEEPFICTRYNLRNR